MVNPPNNNYNGIMETYDDRPISMYDNLNNNMTTTAMNNSNISNNSSNTPKIIKAPTTMATSTMATTPTTSTKTNGAAHSTPFTDITFKFNENNNNNLQQQQQLPQQHQQQQLQLNGNRNLNQMPPNTGNNNAAVYATPYKTTATKPVLLTNTASPPPPPSAPLTSPAQQLHQQQLPTNILTSSSPSLLHTTNPTIATLPTAALDSDTFNSYNNRPLSQHSQSELNETSHSIAAVKAALNEAKSKFFGLNGYAPQQQQYEQQQHHYDDNHNGNDRDESQNHNLLPSSSSSTPTKIQQQVQTPIKPQPKYQNIPENSAIFRNQIAGSASGGGADADAAPELPPKPVEYQKSKNNNTTTPDYNRKMPAGTSYNQISLNDIDSAASRSQVTNSMFKVVCLLFPPLI